VDICKDHGINFIGPRSEHIRIMGDKSTARDTMKVPLTRSEQHPAPWPRCNHLRAGQRAAPWSETAS
jgi:pyruvate carboxylase